MVTQVQFLNSNPELSRISFCTASKLRCSEPGSGLTCNSDPDTTQSFQKIEQRPKPPKSKLDAGWHNRGCRKQSHGIRKPVVSNVVSDVAP